MAQVFLEPGLHWISREEYEADPCPEPSLRSSIAKQLISQSPLHVRATTPRLGGLKPPSEAHFDLGQAAHEVILGGNSSVVVVEAADWRTKAAKNSRDDAREAGKTPILRPQFDRVIEMVERGRQQIKAHEDLPDDLFSPDSGRSEATLIWQQEGVWCRARLDWLTPAIPVAAVKVLYDYKTTGQSAHPNAQARLVYSLGYDLQAAFHCAGIKAVLGIEKPELRFVVQETSPPYALSVIGLPPVGVVMGEQKMAAALRIWRECMESGVWPGYPLKTCFVDPPPYLEAEVAALGEELL